MFIEKSYFLQSGLGRWSFLDVPSKRGFVFLGLRTDAKKVKNGVQQFFVFLVQRGKLI